MATRKQLDTARETRLWIVDIVVPVVTAGIVLATNPHVQEWCKDKATKVKTWFTSKKKEEPKVSEKIQIIRDLKSNLKKES